MDFNQFGNNLEDSTNFLIEKLSELHPWDEEWKYNIAVKLVPIYVRKLANSGNIWNPLAWISQKRISIISLSSHPF